MAGVSPRLLKTELSQEPPSIFVPQKLTENFFLRQTLEELSSIDFPAQNHCRTSITEDAQNSTGHNMGNLMSCSTGSALSRKLASRTA
ncbi:hypothetical protein IHE44_0013245 [Lamprotornis superbus]|uniref:Uncharacterized protein n=1 Tax=Lamprotornis superbus TaxID=245042 RepID=A0A835NIJ7_9PASS|nr:hypothetical protein IHE44_0013245 [Lamprotornis superbus]